MRTDQKLSAPTEHRVLRVEQDWIWMDKAPGQPVFAPHAEPDGPCLLRTLLELHPEQQGDWPDGFDGGIAHRLDVSTSGIVLVARSLEALERARAAFAAKILVKHYRLMSGSDPGWTELHLRRELAHHRTRRDRMVVRKGPTTRHRGKWYPAETRFESAGVPHWKARMKTGVMHQIRAHAAEAGIPLLGDDIYGGLTWIQAPPGVSFPLHHCRMEGIGGCPYSPPWFA